MLMNILAEDLISLTLFSCCFAPVNKHIPACFTEPLLLRHRLSSLVGFPLTHRLRSAEVRAGLVALGATTGDLQRGADFLGDRSGGEMKRRRSWQ